MGWCCARVVLHIKALIIIASLAFFLARKVISLLEFTRQYTTRDVFRSDHPFIRLRGGGTRTPDQDQTQARELLYGNSVANKFQLDQRSTILETHEDQRSISGGSEQDQSVQQRSTFEQTVLASLEAMDQQLNYLIAKVEGPSEPPETPASNSSHLVTPLTETTRRLWADIPVDEVPDYSAPLPWEDDTEAEPSTLREVSENTKKALTPAFSLSATNPN